MHPLLSRLARPAARSLNYVKTFGLIGGLASTWAVELGLAFRPGDMCKTSLPGDTVPFNLRLTPADVGSFWQIFIKTEYAADNFIQKSTLSHRYSEIISAGRTPYILDVGANIGATARWFAKKYPKAHIIAVEPDAENFKLLVTNTAHLPQVQCMHAAAAEASGLVNICNPDAGAASFQTSAANPNSGDIRAVTMAELFDMAGHDNMLLVKMDIEGAETRVFEADCSWLDRTAALMIEIHDWKLPGQASSAPVLRELAAHRYDVLLQGENLMAFNIAHAPAATTGTGTY
jgi:FkbM family methyltransferase